MATFFDVFGYAPEAQASAPGRVNLLGEHTDYNGGFVLPAPIPQRTRVEIARSRDGCYYIYSDNLNESVSYRDNDAIRSGYARYVYGCIEMLRRAGHAVSPITVWISSDVPIGAGLSSSAALEVALLRALRELFGVAIDDLEIAQLAQAAEIHYAEVRCGIMDQMASSLGQIGQMLFLDTRTLERRLLPFPQEAELIVIDSGVPRTLASSKYNERRSECEQGAQLLGASALRDVDDLAIANVLPEPLNRRARHVISENQRVLAAAAGLSAAEFGALMNASHASLQDDFEVSIPAVDLLVQLLQQHPGAYGARLTGAGFGGACVALGQAGRAEQLKREVIQRYRAAGFHGRALV